MKQINEIYKIVDSLTKFNIKLTKYPGDSLEVEAVNSQFFFTSDYMDWVKRKLSNFETCLYFVIANSKQEQIQERFKLIFEKVMKAEFIKHNISALRKEIKKYPEASESPYQFHFDCILVYSKIRPSLVKILERMIQINEFGKQGITIASNINKLKTVYNMLMQKGIVENNKESTFIESLTGQRIISPVRWVDGASLVRFFQGLKKEKISVDVIQKGKISWKRVFDVFPETIGKKRLNRLSRTNTNSLQYEDDPFMNSVVNSLK